jgi:Na+/melibiose symporter-like transporter
MRSVRMLGRIAAAVCVSCSAILIWSALKHERVDAGWLLLAYAFAFLFALASRLCMLRSVAWTAKGCLLVPLYGRPQRVPPVVDVYERGEDVIALGVDGRPVVLGVDRFPFRDAPAVRRLLVEELRRRGDSHLA